MPHVSVGERFHHKTVTYSDGKVGHDDYFYLGRNDCSFFVGTRIFVSNVIQPHFARTYTFVIEQGNPFQISIEGMRFDVHDISNTGAVFDEV